MNENLEKLVLLQALDLELKHLRAELVEAPRRVARAEQERAQAEAALNAAREALAREEALRRRQESDIQDRRTKIVRLRKQMDTATSTAQVNALEHEIKFAEEAIAKLEDDEMASMERTETGEAEQAGAADTLARKTSALATEKARAADTLTRNNEAVATREAERKTIRAAVEESVLSTYDRIAKTRGTAVSDAVDHKCSACQMMVRPQRWNDLTGRDHQADIFHCETCGRMLFWDPRRDAPGAWPPGERLNAAKQLEGRA